MYSGLSVGQLYHTGVYHHIPHSHTLEVEEEGDQSYTHTQTHVNGAAELPWLQ